MRNREVKVENIATRERGLVVIVVLQIGGVI